MQNKNKNRIKIAFVGDIMLDRHVGGHFNQSPEDFNFPEISNILQGHDLVMASLKNPISTNGSPHPRQQDHLNFRCHPERLAVLHNLGVNVVNLANNHTMDYGETALRDTMEHLDTGNIRHLGAGCNHAEANRPLLLEINGVKLALVTSSFIYLASTCRAKRHRTGIADYRFNRILKQVRALSQQGYQVIVTLHWGLEYSFYPVPYQRKRAQRMIDAGASMVLGHGTHYPQGIESYKDRDIVYSVGNFIFDEPFVHANRGYIYTAEISADGKASRRSIYPYRIKNHIPVLEPAAEQSRLGKFILGLNAMYDRKSRAFWKQQNNLYFQDILSRVFRLKSLKYLLLPPLSFYPSVGLRNYIRKFKVSNFLMRP